MMMEFTPFCTWPETLLLVDAHQSSNDLSSACAASTCKPRSCSTANQTCQLKTQETSRWSFVSSVLSQSAQAAGWWSPFLASLSAVQQFLCATVHMKNLHLLGAQLCQVLLKLKLNLMFPHSMHQHIFFPSKFIIVAPWKKCVKTRFIDRYEAFRSFHLIVILLIPMYHKQN